MADGELFHPFDMAVCDCGHVAIDHHAVDQSPRNGGCFAEGSGLQWSPRPKCRCTLTGPMVVAS